MSSAQVFANAADALSKMGKEWILEMLRNDNQYYGEFGNMFMSNSNIKVLLENPRDYGIAREDNANLLIGRYFHHAILEPEKAAATQVVDTTRRSTNVYKDALASSSETILMLQHEKDSVDELVASMMDNLTFFDLIEGDDHQFETPAIGTMPFDADMWFKGKADIITPQKVRDLKTTSDIKAFKSSAYKYGYDSQAFIYRELFDRDMEFLVIDKKTHLMGRFECSEEFYQSGREKVMNALDVYYRFFGKDATETIESSYIEQVL